MEPDRQPKDDELVERAKRAPRDDLRPFEIDDAEDLAQEVFVKAFFGISRFEGRSSFRTWLWRIKVNHCLSFLQRGKRRPDINVDDPVSERAPEPQVEPTGERDLEARDDRAPIDRALDAMSATLRVPLLLRDFDGLSYQEIAEELGVSLSAIKMRIKRGREEFRLRYIEAGGQPI